MNLFFEEFEAYIYDTYGEKSYLKSLMEDLFLPLKESISEISKEDILNSLFSDKVIQNDIKESGKKLKTSIDKIKDFISLPLSGNNLSKDSINKPEKESGLLETLKVELYDISDVVESKIYNMLDYFISNSSRANLEDNNQYSRGPDSNDSSGESIMGSLLKGVIGAGGLATIFGAFMSSNEWKGTLKLAGNALLSLSGLQGGMKVFFGKIEEGFKTISKFFAESKAVQFISKTLKLDTMFKGIKELGFFKFLGKGLKFLKRIPWLGSIISFAMAYDRFKDGDTVGGWMEIASGVANFFPGVGTAISIGIDVITAFKDYATGGTEEASKLSAKDQIKLMLEKLPTFISENLKKFGNWAYTNIKDAVVSTIDYVKENYKKLPRFLGETLTKLAIVGGEFFFEKLSQLKDYGVELGKDLRKKIDEKGGIINFLKSLGSKALEFITNTAIPKIQEGFFKLWDLGVAGLKGLFDISKNITGEFFMGVFDTLQEKFNIKEKISILYGIIKEKYEALLNKIKDFVSTTIEETTSMLTFGLYDGKTISSAINEKIDMAANKLTFGAFEDKNPNVESASKQLKVDDVVDILKKDDNGYLDDIKKGITELILSMKENTEITAESGVAVGTAIIGTAGAGSGGSSVNVVNNLNTDSTITNWRNNTRSRRR